MHGNLHLGTHFMLQCIFSMIITGGQPIWQRQLSGVTNSWVLTIFSVFLWILFQQWWVLLTSDCQQVKKFMMKVVINKLVNHYKVIMCQMVPMSVLMVPVMHNTASVSVHLYITHVTQWSTGVIISLHQRHYIGWIPVTMTQLRSLSLSVCYDLNVANKKQKWAMNKNRPWDKN